MMTPARQRVWFEKTARSIGRGSAPKIRSRPHRDISGPIRLRQGGRRCK